MVLFGRSKFTRLIVPGVTPPDVHTLSAAMSVSDESGTRLTIHRPRPDDGDALPREIFHEVRFFHQVENSQSVRYRQGLRVK